MSFAPTPPVLETDRLRLRPLRHGDFEPFARLMGSPRAALMGGPFDRRAAWGVFCHEIALWSLYGHGGLAIDLRETGACVGVVEINAGPLFPERELGWQLFDGFEGAGYATEAAAALRDWAWRETDVALLVSYVDPENRASAAVAERLGAALDASAAPQDPGDLVYRHFDRRAP